MTTRVIAIVALDHSGSHLLSQLLGAHSHCVSIGELHNYDKFTNRSSGGNVTSNYDEDELFRGLDRTPMEGWHQLIRANAEQKNAGITTLVDNSKRVSWCQALMKNPDLEVHPVHLIRDPRALLRYWLISYDNPKKIRRQRIRLSRMAPLQAPALLSCPPLELYTRKWLIRNLQATRLLQRAGQPANLVTYHDLATSPARALEALMPRFGLDYEAGQLRYGEAQQHGTQKRDYQAASSRSAIELDVRWQDYLHEAQIRTVLEDARLISYLNRLGLSFGRDGLTAFD